MQEDLAEAGNRLRFPDTAKALEAALGSGQIAGAGLDVLTIEPPSASNPLLQARNCLVTPHIAWATRAARARLMDIAVANAAYSDRQPVINANWEGVLRTLEVTQFGVFHTCQAAAQEMASG